MAVFISKLRYCIAFYFLIALCGTGSLWAQEAAAQHKICLKSGNITPTENADHWLDSMSAQPVREEPIPVLIHFNTLPTSAQLAALKQNGVTLLEYLPENTYSAFVHFPVSKEAILAMPVHSIINAKPAWKASDYVWKQVKSKHGAVEVLVSFYGGIDPAAIKQFITGMGGQINHGKLEQYGAYKVIIEASKVASLAQWYGVQSISPVSDIVPLDLESCPAVKGNVAKAAKVYGGYGLAGDSVTVGVGDDASGIYHADINDRITNFNPGPPRNHGEHVNGIVGGSGNVDPFGQGMAPHVNLLDFLYDLILPATGAMYTDYHMTITNNSYEVIAGNCDYSGTYDGYSRFLDTLSVQYPEVLHVFASGNDGYLACSPYPQGFATVGGGYQPAKNDVVVGSMTDFYEEVSDESRGPVKDGRLKPEIEATGLIAYSTVGTDAYEWAAGTSMASPHVAGGLALLTQRYKQLNAGAQPRADLLKAILLNGALDLGNPGPDYSHGFGEMDVYRSLQMIDSAHYTTNNINNGDSQSFTITVPPNTGLLKVMLCWSDVPASTSSAKQLVNDLDLTVKTPTGTTHYPLVLDPTPANVNNNATEQPDHLNNVEQVTINNPVAGTYTIKTKGYSIPFGPQHYVIAYDVMPSALHLTYPLGGEQLMSSSSPFDTVRVFWDAGTDGNPFTVEISQDNGAHWTTISNSVPPGNRHCDFLPVGLSTCNMLARVSRNNTGESATSGRFCLNDRPLVTLDTAQCPGYVKIHWSPVLNATGYYLVRKTDNYMHIVDSVVADTTYTFSGMPLNQRAYVAVQPKLDGMPGYRSIAVSTVANTGNCTLAGTTGDIMIGKLVAPLSGRMYTKSQLSASDILKVLVRDLYQSACSNYSVSWKINAGAWQTILNPGLIPANGTTLISIPGVDLSVLGSYTISLALHNIGAADPQSLNDSFTTTILNLPNNPIDLTTPFSDDFETMGRVTARHDSIGVSPNGHWDFYTASDSGRMRSFVNSYVNITGNRSISLDAYQTLHTGSSNTFVGTFNLAGYDTATSELRMDFDYLLSGKPKSPSGNVVTARANDTVSWSPLFAYNLATYPGTVTPVKSLSLTDLVRQTNKNFSTATQVSFGQNDTSLIAAPDYGNGLTIDNFRIYTVVNDAALSGIVSPLPNNCGLASPGPLTVRVHNGVNHTLYNIHLYYSLDGGATFSGTVDSIAPKADKDYTFPQNINMAQGTTHSLNVWLTEAGDSYTANDTISNYHFRNSQIITTYPYLENFEAGDGGYYSDGFRNSWKYGTPASGKINKAASGVKAWKTNLTGNYNNLEVSYLYSPCFDLSGLTSPMLSFSIASDIENCGSTLCDAGYMEVSYDGVTWTKLGSVGMGTNWYDSTFNVWNTQGFTRWHVASIPLPQPGAGYTTHFRYVLAADPGTTYEGIAIDDIHIFDRVHPIYDFGTEASSTENMSGNQWADFYPGGKVILAIQPEGQSIPLANAEIYGHDTLYNPGATQYTFGTSFVLRAPTPPADSFGVRLFLTDKQVVAVLNDTTCPSCNPVTDAYSLGITQFSNAASHASENGTLADDTGGVFVYHPSQSVKWVPYDKGYYAEIMAKPFSEFWFNNGGPTGNLPAGTDYLTFMVYRDGIMATCIWHSLIDTAVDTYTVQWSLDSVNFASALDVAAQHKQVADYTIGDPVNFDHHPVIYYRLKWTMTGNDHIYYSPIRKVFGSDSASSFITFDANMYQHQTVLTNWTSYLDPVADHYLLERSVGPGNYSPLTTVSARHGQMQYYEFTDQPQRTIQPGTPVYYRLTAKLQNGVAIILPEKVIVWEDNNTFGNLYPNPTHDGAFSILWFADPGTVMQIHLTDAMGRSMNESFAVSSQWRNTSTFRTLSHLSGVYFVRIDIGGSRYTAKLVFE